MDDGMSDHAPAAAETISHRYAFDYFTRGLLAIATAVLAIAPPVRYFFALHEPARATEVGLQWITSFPHGTIEIATAAVIIESALKILIVREIWRIIGHFRQGEFISRPITTAMHRVSVMLIGISLTGTLGLAVGLGSLWFLDSPLPPFAVISVLLNVPSGAFVCAILGFAIASVFDRAFRLADEARFLV